MICFIIVILKLLQNCKMHYLLYKNQQIDYSFKTSKSEEAFSMCASQHIAVYYYFFITGNNKNNINGGMT